MFGITADPWTALMDFSYKSNETLADRQIARQGLAQPDPEFGAEARRDRLEP